MTVADMVYLLLFMFGGVFLLTRCVHYLEEILKVLKEKL